jgi:hypothetical protein
MHGADALDWIWMVPMMLVMMLGWIVPVALAVYVAVRLANGRPGDTAGGR